MDVFHGTKASNANRRGGRQQGDFRHISTTVGLWQESQVEKSVVCALLFLTENSPTG